MKVLLIIPPCRESRPAASLPLGFAYIASVLRNAGHDVSFMNIDAFRHSKEKVEELVKKAEFDVAATGGLITVYSYVKWLSRIVKKYHPKKMLAIGGAMPTCVPHVVLEKTEADAVILGEGEYTMLELVEAVEKNRGLEKVKGLWFKKDGKIIRNERRELIKNLDELPFPAWDLLPMDLYLSRPTINHLPPNLKSITVSTARGCPYGCTFCYNVFGARSSRKRSADSIISEIKILQEKYDVKVIAFCDDLFIINKKDIMEFCDKMIEQKIDLIWASNGRVNTVDMELLKKMKKAGCVGILYGFESGSQKMLDAMNKQVTVKQIKDAINATREAGLHIYPNFMFGIPGETVETIKETVNFIKEMDMYIPGIFIASPFPGSQLYDYAKSKGLIKDEEKFIESCGECLSLTLNLTDMSDSELLHWRDWATHEIISTYRRRHPIEALEMDWQKLRNTLKIFGFTGTVKKIFNRAKRRLAS